jgi:hypothetical protein
MTRHRQGPPFIQYALPESKGKPKPRPVTTMMLGEEGGSPPPGTVTTLAVGEETASHAPSRCFAGVEGSFPPAANSPPRPLEMWGQAHSVPGRARERGSGRKHFTAMGCYSPDSVWQWAARIWQ